MDHSSIYKCLSQSSANSASFKPSQPISQRTTLVLCSLLCLCSRNYLFSRRFKSLLALDSPTFLLVPVISSQNLRHMRTSTCRFLQQGSHGLLCHMFQFSCLAMDWSPIRNVTSLVLIKTLKQGPRLRRAVPPRRILNSFPLFTIVSQNLRLL